MTRKKLPNGLTQQQEDFCKEYVKCGIAFKAYQKAYPTSLNWTRNSIDSKASNLLNNSKIEARVNELNEQATSTLMQSTKINHRKLLETALQTMLECNTPAERQHFVSLIKLLFQKEGMLQPESVTTVNIQNNQITAEVSDYLNL